MWCLCVCVCLYVCVSLYIYVCSCEYVCLSVYYDKYDDIAWLLRVFFVFLLMTFQRIFLLLFVCIWKMRFFMFYSLLRFWKTFFLLKLLRVLLLSLHPFCFLINLKSNFCSFCCCYRKSLLFFGLLINCYNRFCWIKPFRYIYVECWSVSIFFVLEDNGRDAFVFEI